MTPPIPIRSLPTIFQRPTPGLIAFICLFAPFFLLPVLAAAQGGGAWGGGAGGPGGGRGPRPEKTVEYPPAGDPPLGLWHPRDVPTLDKTQATLGTLQIKVRVRGTLSPLIETRIPAKTWGVITDMALEGARVEKGDMLFKLDITDTSNSYQINLANMIREVANHLKDVETNGKRKRSTEMDLELSGWNAEESRLRLIDQEEGVSADTFLNAQVRVLTAEKSLLLAQQQETSTKDLGAKGFASANEVRAAQQKRVEAEIELHRSQLAFDKIQQGTDPEVYAQSELNYRSARDKVRELVENLEGVYTQLQMDENQFRRTMADRYSNLRDLAKRIDDAVVTSPHRGRAHVLERWGQPITPGREVWTGIPVYSLPDPTKLKVVLKVDERHISLIKLGQPAWMKIPAFPNEIFGGRVIKIADSGKDEFSDFLDQTVQRVGAADRQTFDVTVALDKEDPRLAQGLTADVCILAASKPNTLLLPADVVLREGANAFVILSDNAAAGIQTPVTIGDQSDGLVEILSGVTAGQTVEIPSKMLSPVSVMGAGAGAGGKTGSADGSDAGGAGSASAPKGATP
ncbi:MAG TPA: hypothetical protein VL860_14125 [Planctomycetota bacterium]|nr:hypothetical protein [Planctomycetota bacterium]